jgi:hypothetical protein
MGHDSCTIPRARWLRRRLTCLGSLTFGLFLLGLPGGSVGETQGSRAADGGPPVLTGRLVAVGIPGAGALSPVGTFQPGGPIHDHPDFAVFTQPGAVLDPVRLLVASASNFGAPWARPDAPAGAILSLDPGAGLPLVIPPAFAAAGGQATALAGRVHLLTAQTPAFVNNMSNPQAVTAALAPVAAPTGIVLNHAFGRLWLANAPAGLRGVGVVSVLNPDGWPRAGAPSRTAGGVFAGTLTNRQPQQVPGALSSGAVGTALLGPSPDGGGQAVGAVALADGSLVQVHEEHGVDGLAPAGTIGALDDVEDTTDPTPSVTRVGLALHWGPDRLLYVADPRHNAVAILTLGDNGSVFCLQRVLHFVNPDLNVPVDVAPAVPEVAHRGLASNTTLAGGADLYIANRGNGTLVRLRQDGTVVAVRQVALPGHGALGADRLNGIAVSPDALRLWVTVSGVVPEFPQAEGFVLELPAFGTSVVSRK